MVSNMGPRYLLFRSWHEIKRRSGLLKRAFPTDVEERHFISVDDWRNLDYKFFFQNRESLEMPRNPTSVLQEQTENILQEKITFFNSLEYELGTGYDWITNPENGFKYDITNHWTEIADFSTRAGDIKYVWEKSRFTYLYTIIRYDYHFGEDHSAFVFDEIIDWINKNPVNRGPNYRCSQEISLRILNWIFALNFYKHSANLTQGIFNKMINSIYWQLKHVYANINFSRVAVRNNHAVTETMMLYLSGILFPFVPEAASWSRKGQKWFEKEIAYQVYPDGTYLQFSMNYHRVVVQLLTWALRLSELNGRTLSKVVYDRANATVKFLLTATNENTGHLPNYGANDGSLFFPLNDNEFRDYRPQLQALANVLGKKTFNANYEDSAWFGSSDIVVRDVLDVKTGCYSFPDGGYYIVRDSDSLTFICCGSYRDRPSQADNLHLDIWINDENILRDCGTYKYNTDPESIKYFFGTASHNTVMLGDFDQMQKGGRFIWYHWTKAEQAGWRETNDYYEFTGTIRAFGHVGKNIVHKRSVRKYKGYHRWEVTDELIHQTGLAMNQIWNLSKNNVNVCLDSFDENGGSIPAKKLKGWYSESYGIKEESRRLIFTTSGHCIRTLIHEDVNKINEHTSHTSVLSGKA